MVEAQTIATIAAVSVSLSLPLYFHGIWVILNAERVTWSVLKRHLASIIPALLFTAVPVVGWMIPRSLNLGFSGLVAVHIFLALQSYALLLIGLWGIVPIFRAKRRYNLYRNPDQDIELDELDERMPQWRKRLRLGVFGHFGLWLLAYLLGGWLYVSSYGPF